MAIKKGIIYSVLFHLFLILIFSIVTCDLNVTLPEPIELGISMGLEEGIYEEPGMSAAGTPDEGSIVPVDVPETKAPPIEGEETLVKKDEILNEGVVDTLLREVEETGKHLEPKVASVGEESLGVGGKEGMPFSITGALSTRKILRKVIPLYPAGYEERTKVEVRLTVAPGGDVTRLLLIKTGGAVFDRITLEALREWIFEPLRPNAEQVDQEGTITFFYELK
jgi:TonB family protein